MPVVQTSIINTLYIYSLTAGPRDKVNASPLNTIPTYRGKASFLLAQVRPLSSRIRRHVDLTQRLRLTLLD